MKKLLLYLLILFPFFYLTSSILHLTSFLYSYPPGWSDDILISPDTVGYRVDPDVSADTENNVWVVWDSVSWGTGYVYYSKRDSLGNSIIPETQVSVSGYSHYCRLAVDKSDNIHIIWRELSPIGFGIGYVKLANDGSVIVFPNLAIDGAGASNRPFFDMAFDHQEKSLHIAWEEVPSGYEQISYTLLDSLGDTLVSNVQVSTPDTSAYYPGIGVDSMGNNHIAYRSDSSMIERLIYIKLDKYGNVLVPHKTISIGSSPSIKCDENQNVHIFYTNPEGPGNHIYYIKLDNNGNVLIPPTCLSVPPYESNSLCHAAIDSQQFLHIVWEAVLSQQGARFLYTKMDTLGSTVVPPMLVVYPPHTFWAIYPRIAADHSDRLHLVWADGRIDTILRIFYKRGENVGVEETARLKTANLAKLSVFPNPFSKLTKISFGNVQGAKSIGLKIYDATGRIVKDFSLPTAYSLVPTVVTWTGTDNSGNPLPAGVYFIQLSSATNTQTTPVILLR